MLILYLQLKIQLLMLQVQLLQQQLAAVQIEGQTAPNSVVNPQVDTTPAPLTESPSNVNILPAIGTPQAIGGAPAPSPAVYIEDMDYAYLAYLHNPILATTTDPTQAINFGTCRLSPIMQARWANPSYNGAALFEAALGVQCPFSVTHKASAIPLDQFEAANPQYTF